MFSISGLLLFFYNAGLFKSYMSKKCHIIVILIAHTLHFLSLLPVNLQPDQALPCFPASLFLITILRPIIKFYYCLNFKNWDTYKCPETL